MPFSKIASLLEAKTESEFFIRMCALLPKHRIKDIKCSTELVALTNEACPGLELTFFMILPHARQYGTTGFGKDKVWVFTLSADGTLSWQIAHYKMISPNGLSDPTYTNIEGLKAIQQYLRETNGDLPIKLLSANVA